MTHEDGDDDRIPPGSWTTYRRLVVSQLDDLNTKFAEMQETLAAIREQLVKLQTKAGIIGGLGGVIFGGIVSWLFGRSK